MTDFKKVFIDTAPFIYFIEKDINNPQYFVFPYRNKSYSYIDMFNRLVETTDMEIVEINQEIARKAA